MIDFSLHLIVHHLLRRKKVRQKLVRVCGDKYFRTFLNFVIYGVFQFGKKTLELTNVFFFRYHKLFQTISLLNLDLFFKPSRENFYYQYTSVSLFSTSL